MCTHSQSLSRETLVLTGREHCGSLQANACRIVATLGRSSLALVSFYASSTFLDCVTEGTIISPDLSKMLPCESTQVSSIMLSEWKTGTL